MFKQAGKCTTWKMSQPRELMFILYLLATNIGIVLAFPDKYEFREPDSNLNVNLLDLLPDNTESEKDQLKESSENNSTESWKGKWFPSLPGEPTSPPKVYPKNQNLNSHHDGSVPMGIKSKTCDDGKTNLTVDWDYSKVSYTCFGEKIDPDINVPSEEYCDVIPKHYVARHKCMAEIINYEDDIPLFGTHRPIWPVYGEYKYIPKQRWLHSLEHGGLVMLYHPCANKLVVNLLKEMVKSCIRRHIITPYELLDEKRPLALLTWGCRLTMSNVNQKEVTDFIQKHALDAPEKMVYKDGDFDDQLIQKANIVSDEQDSILCSKPM